MTISFSSSYRHHTHYNIIPPLLLLVVVIPVVVLFPSSKTSSSLFALATQSKVDKDWKQPLVEVYDNVLSKESSEWLHGLVKDRPNTDEVFVFPLEDPTNHSPLEQLLNQLMHELYPLDSGDYEPRYYVEFWKRTPWVHISAHADMDASSEHTIEDPDTEYNHPETGHVLYLDVAPAVEGPTLVWNVTKGVDFYKQPTSEMVVVPAVEGRLTRFNGRALHAVPRPADLYWTYQQDTREGPEFQRSVLLFNTWPVSGGNLLGYKTLNGTTTKDGKEETNDDNVNNDEEKEEPLKIQHQCNSKSDWVSIDITRYEPPTGNMVLIFQEYFVQGIFNKNISSPIDGKSISQGYG